MRSAVFAAAVTFAGIACANHVASVKAAPACPAGTFGIAGVCLTHDQAVAYCGKGARPEGGGCAPTACDHDAPTDLASGECIPRLSLRTIEGRRGAPDAEAGCTSDAGLVIEGESMACLPRPLLCGRGATWASGACRPDPVCPAGAIADATGACVTVVGGTGADRVLDVGAWIRLVLGPDGGDGTPAVCGPLRERPWRAGVAAHGSATIDVRVDLVFPDNAVSAAQAEVRARRHFDPHDMDSATPVAAARSMDPLWDALRAVGGTASAASASVEVRCPIEGGFDVPGGPPPRKESPSHVKTPSPP